MGIWWQYLSFTFKIEAQETNSGLNHQKHMESTNEWWILGCVLKWAIHYTILPIYIYIHIYIHIYIYGNFNFEDLWDHWTIKKSSDLGGACRSSWDHWIFGWKGLLSDIYSLLKQTSDLSEKISLGLYRSPKLENFGRTLLDQMNKRPRRSMQKPYLRGLANYILR
jgi:hypothetical protein